MNSPSTGRFPERVICRVRPAFPSGVAICLRFHMERKNDYNYIVFSNERGMVQLDSRKLLNAFDDERRSFAADYADPRVSFSGKVTARILNRDELLGAVEAYDIMSPSLSYPPDYRSGLEKALQVADEALGLSVEVELA